MHAKPNQGCLCGKQSFSYVYRYMTNNDPPQQVISLTNIENDPMIYLPKKPI